MDKNTIIYSLMFSIFVFIVVDVILIFFLCNTENTEYLEMRDDERV
jgi:uncharacterized protein YqhQ